MYSFALGQFMTIFIMSVALGFDAFSLGLGMGMRGVRLLHIAWLSFVIGLFHILMPLVGIFMGHYMSSLLGQVAVSIGGILLVVLGGHMLYSSLSSSNSSEPIRQPLTLWGLALFALSVSVDSFSVGVSLGMFATDVLLTVLMFGIVGGIMSILGLLLGKHVSRIFGGYGEAVGGIILLAFGLNFLL
ncbi:manganese efflux pump MntP family protein [Paenibacillus sp. N1-5-1-14]|uniref:manganese efflux pump MntP n=1 Tax=Paenibacillus radicibacter TaxID=2972488 RepID=UPI0021595F15|nr:manganese efflux pump MntP family protein [Paenibacillus radicibacter]MCR8645104.1 manganese efflux pump MntP family protein [Paenibacillus radicibacter]